MDQATKTQRLFAIEPRLVRIQPPVKISTPTIISSSTISNSSTLLFQHDYLTKSNLNNDRMPLKPLNINIANITAPPKISANTSYSNSCPNKINVPFRLLNSSNITNTTVPLARVNKINCSTISLAKNSVPPLKSLPGIQVVTNSAAVITAAPAVQCQEVVEVLPASSNEIYLDSNTLTVEINNDLLLPQSKQDPDLLKARQRAASAIVIAGILKSTVASTSTFQEQDNVSSEEEIDLASDSDNELFVDKFINLKNVPPEVKEILNENDVPNLNTTDLTTSGGETTCESDASALSDVFESKMKPKKLKSRKQRNRTHQQSTSDIERLNDKVLGLLPKDYSNKIVNIEAVDGNDCEQLITTFRVNVSKVDDVIKWKDQFELSSNTNYRVEHTRKPKSEKRIMYKKTFRCHHNTLAEKSQSKTPHEKHTKCPASISQDIYLKTHPMEILLKSTHNHPVEAAAGDVLRHRRPCLGTVQKFTDMFKNTSSRITPAYAMERNLEDLEMSDQDLIKIGDGAFVPERPYKLYKKIMKDQSGEPYGPGMISALEKYVENYNSECGEVCAKFGSSSDGNDHYIAVCTAMMKRIHTHYKASGEVMFVDSSGCMDNNNARVFVILTPSVVCGLPLGLLITFSEKEPVILAALQLWKEVLPENAFYGRGSLGPKIIISDASTSERNSVSDCWPMATLLLCLFHVLQAMWRYVWDSHNGVEFKDKAYVYHFFREIVYAPTVEEFKNAYEEALQDRRLLLYPIVWKHFEDYKNKAKEWALSYRVDLLTRGHHTNNFCEACMRIIKDTILQRARAYNTVQLLDLLLTKLDKHFKRKLAFVVSNRIRASRSYKYRIKAEKLKPLVAERLFSSENLFRVENTQKKTEYVVDSQLNICSCPIGMCGAPCKHQMMVAKKFKISNQQFLPTSDPAFRMILFFIMTGHTNIPDGFLKTLKGDNVSVDLNINPDYSNNTPTNEKENEDKIDIPLESSEQPPDLDCLKEEIRNVAEDLCDRLTNSLYLSEPCQKFVNNYWTIVKRGNFESTLASALATFSKDQALYAPTCRKVNINVQPTAPPRRAKCNQGGKHAQAGGRPNMAVVAETIAVNPRGDHGYAPPSKVKRNTQVEPSWAVPPVKKPKVRHSLDSCVGASVRLPK
ncbi:putative periplasmic serine endoprotease DegP-like [Frankliniella fusca]|uniref:Periplasmic serine endoprotease DegP-like n=1 Tax=Frankliniella fusca TaxID=407009 RepID=A0AAE1HMK9_9NEOP|nr:putative periplasmic serine endoprotease DegP-like [Frankliniella fusca]